MFEKPGILTNNSLKQEPEDPIEYIESKAQVSIQTLRDIPAGEAWIVMVYGPPKSGKTYFWTS
jgi:polynucleotide 5'-kinase involved in rRNA processing